MNYKTVFVGDLFPRVSIGGTPSRGAQRFFGGPHVWVSIRDMNGKMVIDDSFERLTDEGVRNSNCKLIRKGSLLFSFKLTVGRVAKAGVDLYTNEAIAAFDVEDAKNANIDLDYLALVLPAIAQADPTKNSMGAALLNKQKIARLKIPLPSIAEQRHIASSLSAQLAAAEEARQAAQSQLNDSKRLIPALLAATFDHLDDAEWRPIGDVAKTTSGTTPSRGQKDLWQPPLHPWVKTGEVAFKPIYQTEESVSAKALAECSLTLLPAGTVLVAMYGQGKTRGQSALLRVAATTNQACFAILPTPALDPEYLQLWLRHSYEALRALSDSRGGNQSNLNGALMNAFEVPLLPLEKQQAIARHIMQAIEDANALQETIEQQLRDIERLPSRLLAQAFDTQ
jgi:type I restriction enzyme S subunit